MLTDSPDTTVALPVPSARETDSAVRKAVEALEAEWHDEAILACEQALKADIECAEAFFLMGLIHFDLDEPTKAIELLERAHEMNPSVLEFVEALAAIQVRLGKVKDALFYAKLATTLAPHPTIRNLLPQRFGSFFKNFETGDPQIYLYRARRSFEAGAFAGAVAHCRRQLELTPGDTDTLRLMSRAGLKVGQFGVSISAIHAVLHAGPPQAADLARLGSALYAIGHGEDAEACQDAAVSLSPDDPDLHSAVIAGLVRRPGTGAQRLAAVHTEWRQRHAAAILPRALAPAAPAAPAAPGTAERPLRVAYLSGAFCQNDLVEQFEPVLHLHRRDRVEACCYSDGTRTDTVTECLMRAAAKWTDITGIDDETVWEILRGDGIDIAVDLSGHFEGGRPLVFARRPAPVTVSWLGYPHPLGIAGLDYFLTDAAAWPAHLEKPESGERIWTLPRAAFAYVAPASMPATAPLPAERSGTLTFGVNCDLTLLTPALVRGWATMLWAHDKAALLICNRFDQDEAGVQRVVDLFAHFGLRTRMDVVNMSDNFQTPFAFYDHVDIALDTGSCESLVENCRALWMGVPVIGLAGDHHAARLGASLVAGVGHAEWSAGTSQELTALATDLGSDLGKLSALRAGLRDEVGQSPIGDAAGLTASLEDAYRDMWRRRVRA